MNIKYLNQRREELGLTNKQLAELSGVPFSTLTKITSGIIKNPKLGTIQSLALALDCKLDDFLDTHVFYAHLTLTEKETQLILQYRDQPEMQEAVNKLLGI